MEHKKYQRIVGKKSRNIQQKNKKIQSYNQQQPIVMARSINAPMKKVWWQPWQSQTCPNNNNDGNPFKQFPIPNMQIRTGRLIHISTQ